VCFSRQLFDVAFIAFGDPTEGHTQSRRLSLSARIPTVAAIEGNARQYCPADNAGWRDRYPACSA
jgi:hypothetical protein